VTSSCRCSITLPNLKPLKTNVASWHLNLPGVLILCEREIKCRRGFWIPNRFSHFMRPSRPVRIGTRNFPQDSLKYLQFPVIGYIGHNPPAGIADRAWHRVRSTSLDVASVLV